MNSIKKNTFIALLIAQALVLYVVESMIPLPFIAPGAKLGLSNIITVVSICILGFKDSSKIVVLKILLSTFFAGSLSSLLYSLSGGVLSLIAMTLMYKIGEDKISIIGVSIIGAIFHNIGQIIVSIFIISNVKIALYLPILLLLSLGTGIFNGITANYLLKHLKRIGFIKKLLFDEK
ncbi:MAG: Gx transporter family protein [Clostridium sp.]